jgi:ComF family protein
MLKKERPIRAPRNRARLCSNSPLRGEYGGWSVDHFPLVPRQGLGDKCSVQMLTAPFRAMLDFALPERCPSCGMIAGGGGSFCSDCWTSLTFLSDPACARCDLPLPYASAEAQFCAACIAQPPRHDGIKAVVAYGDIARDVALKLKYGGRIGLARMIAGQLLRYRHVLPVDGLLVPVPLHWTRLWSRSFNQSVLIARELSSMAGFAHCPDLLRRTRRTTPLGGLSGKDRRKMVAGAFDLNPSQAEKAKGQHILLVDDVYTSGATTDACVRVLKKGGAASVTILCWARVLPGALELADAS